MLLCSARLFFIISIFGGKFRVLISFHTNEGYVHYKKRKSVAYTQKKSRQKTAKKLVGRGRISKLSPIAIHSSYESFCLFLQKKKVNFVFSSISDRFLLWKSSIRHPITISQLKFMQTHQKTVKIVSKIKKGFPIFPQFIFSDFANHLLVLVGRTFCNWRWVCVQIRMNNTSQS